MDPKDLDPGLRVPGDEIRRGAGQSANGIAGAPSMKMPSVVFGGAPVPAASSPIKFPATKLFDAELPEIRTPISVLAEITLPLEGCVPPMTLPGDPLMKTPI